MHPERHERIYYMDKTRIRDMESSERPVEKVRQYGIQSLSDAELLALILRCGTREFSAVALAQRILNHDEVTKGLVSLNYITLEDITKIKGVGYVKACQLLAVAEISKRMSMAQFKPRLTYNSPSSIADFFMEEYRYRTVESVFVLFLNGKNSIIKWKELSRGTVNSSPVSPRELFLEALKYDSVSVILMHNHPSGDPEPSEQDILITERIKSAGNMLGIELLDHIILGDKTYFSFSEKGYL